MTEEHEELTDPDPEQQDPESGAGAEQGEESGGDVDISEFQDDPSRNPDDENLEKYKGG